MVKILRKVLNIFIALAISLFFLLLVLQVAPVQNFIAKRVVAKLNQDLNIPLEIDQIQLLFFNTLKVKGIELQSNQNDTLFYADEVRVSVRLGGLLKRKLYVKHVKIKGADFYLAKNKDSTLNLTPIIDSIPKKDKKPKSDKEPFEVFLNRLILADIKFQFEDKTNQNDIQLALGKLNVRLQGMDINKKRFDLQSVDMEDVIFSTTTGKPSTNSEEPKPIPVDIHVSKGIKTKNVELTVINQFTKQDITIHYDRLNVFPDKINLKENHVEVDDIDLKGARVNIGQGILTKNDSLEIEKVNAKATKSPFLWTLETKKLKISKSDFYYSDANKLASLNPQKNGKLSFGDINSQIENIKVAYQNYSAEIMGFEMVYNENLKIKNLIAKASMDSSNAIINDVVLETADSKVELNGNLTFNDVNTPFKDPIVELMMTAKAGRKDLAYFLPNVSVIRQYPDVLFEISTEGTFTDLNINSAILKVEKAVELELSGQVKNATDIKRVGGNLDIKKLIVRKQETEKFLADTLLPDGFILPDTLQLTGNIWGNVSKLKSELEFVSTMGSIDAIVDFKNDTLAKKENFVASLNIKKLNAGRLLDKPDTLGLISMQGDIESNSSGFKNPGLTFDVSISQLGLLNYEYQNIKLKGNYKEKFFNGQSSINDRNVSLAFNGKINVSDSIPEFIFDLQIDSANLGNIHLLPEKTQVAGHLTADITGKEWNRLNGKFNVANAHYATGGEKHELKNLDVDFDQYGDSSRYNLAMLGLASNDSAILNVANINARLFGKQGDLIYEVYLSDTVNSSTNQWIKGDGEFAFMQDTVLLKTDAEINYHKSLTPLNFAFDFKRYQVGEGHQKIALVVNGTNSHMDADAELIKTGKITEIDASAQIDSFNLGLAEPFLAKQFSTFKGRVDGAVTIKGTTDKPDISGEININNTVVNPKIINAPMHINNEQLVFKKDRLTFETFKLTDEQKNTAVINGYIDVADKNNIGFNLNLLATKFQLLNKPAAAGGDFYGDVTADVNADVTGTVLNPVISLTAAFKYDSKFYYVAPESSSGAKKQDGVFVFVNNTQKTPKDTVVPESSTKKIPSSPSNIEISTNLEITDKLTATLITDPYSDENLEFKGNGNLSFKLAEGGEPRLVGTYNITDGKYRLKLYEVLRREFDIRPGSKLSWSGDVLDATADISASYSVNASAAGLQGAYSGSANNSASYSQFPVDVVMHLTGKLLTPEIDFDIELDESYNDAGIQAFILNLNENESELNKQVFSLLLFNSFLTDGGAGKNPLAYELSNTAQKSLSSLLSASLNRFASQYITGANVSFDIKSYNKQQDVLSPVTDFGLDFRKNLFNNRLSVQVGGNLVVDEEDIKNETDIGNNLAGEFLLEYKITKDGNVLLQGYNKTDYGDIVDGELKKTGVALIFNKEFDTFRELFKRKNKEGKDEK